MLHVDLKTFLPELNLTYVDKLSMAASVETRVPFLDYELTEFMARVPAKFKVHGLTGKYLLRKAVADLLPPSIIRRGKVGFGAPFVDGWMLTWLRWWMICFSPSRIQARGYFDSQAVRQLIDQDRQGQEDNTYRLWALLTFGNLAANLYRPLFARFRRLCRLKTFRRG